MLVFPITTLANPLEVFLDDPKCGLSLVHMMNLDGDYNKTLTIVLLWLDSTRGSLKSVVGRERT